MSPLLELLTFPLRLMLSRVGPMPLAPTTPKNPAYCALLTTFIPVIGKPPPSKIPQKVRLLSIPLPIGSHRCAERSIGAVIRMIYWRLEESPGFRFSKKLALPLLCAPPPFPILMFRQPSVRTLAFGPSLICSSSLQKVFHGARLRPGARG